MAKSNYTQEEEKYLYTAGLTGDSWAGDASVPNCICSSSNQSNGFYNYSPSGNLCNGIPGKGCAVGRWVGNISDGNNKVIHAHWDGNYNVGKVVPPSGGQPACSNVCDEDFNELNICVPEDWDRDKGKPTECIKVKKNLGINKYGRLDTFKYLPEGCTFDEKEIKEGATKCIGKGHNNWCPTGYKPGTGLNNNNVVPLTNPYHYSDTCVQKRNDDDCDYTWSTWSPCDEECGGGIQTRNINIIKNPKDGGSACPPPTEERSCNTSPCPEDCDYTWSTWSPCDEDCGGGIQTRNINIIKNPAYGGSACPPPTEEQSCNTSPCPEDCDYTWSTWSPCDEDCGGGIQTRNINITKNSAYGGEACPPSTEKQSCNTFPCPVDISGGINDDNIRELVKLYLNENNGDGVERLTLRNKEDIIKHLGPISEWDVSKVTNMDQLFKNAKNFNEDISKWNVSNVKSMQGTFENATEFNQNISDWNVSKVENMNDLFKNASNFNEDISKWNVSNVKSMKGTFENATEFNQNISDWDVSKVENHENIFKNDIAIKSKYKPIFKCNSSSDCEKNYKCKNGKCVENKLKLEIIIGIIVGSIIVIFFIIFAIIKSKRKIDKNS